MHKLLAKQMARFLGKEGAVGDPAYQELLHAISFAYQDYEENYDMLKLALEVSSDELLEANKKLSIQAEQYQYFLNQLMQFASTLGGRQDSELSEQKVDKIIAFLQSQVEERKYFEEQLRANQFNLRALIENTSDIIWSVDVDLQLLVFNSNLQTLPFMKRDLVPKMHQKLYHLFDTLYLKQFIDLHTRCMQPEKFSVQMQVEGGSEVWHFSFNPILSENKVLGAAVYAHDISAEKREQERIVLAKEVAEHRSTAKSQFLANMSHELRTPLSTIMGYSDILHEELSEKEELKRYVEDVEKISTASKYLLTIIEEILDITLLETGKINLYVKPFAVQALLEEIQEIAVPLMEKGENRFAVRVEPNIGVMQSDMMKLRQIIMNILTNASQYTSCGTITLSVFPKEEDEGDHLIFEIKDDGSGISPEKLVHLFDDQFATPKSEKVQEGFGMGLSITKRYCDLLGGTIRVKSMVDVGTTFTVTLPRQYAAAEEGVKEEI